MILFWKLHWPKGRTAVSLVGFNLLYFKKKKQGCRKKLQGHGPLPWLGVAWLGMTVNFVISSVGGMAKSKKHSNRAHGTGHCTIDDYWFDIDNDHFWPPLLCVWTRATKVDKALQRNSCALDHRHWQWQKLGDPTWANGKKVKAC